MSRTMTVRLSDELAQELAVVSRLSGRTSTEIVRDAILALIADERQRPEFQEGLSRLSEQNRGRRARVAPKGS